MASGEYEFLDGTAGPSTAQTAPRKAVPRMLHEPGLTARSLIHEGPPSWKKLFKKMEGLNEKDPKLLLRRSFS